MTRINVIPVEELSDQHLVAEYRELPRCLKQKIDTKGAPTVYILGNGHMKWAQSHSAYLHKRFLDLVKELQYRGFKTQYTNLDSVLISAKHDYFVSERDIEINRSRIREKYNLKPDWYRWTNRQCPTWLFDKN